MTRSNAVGDFMVAANQLARRFGAKEAVKGITFSIPRGQIFGLLGPNGAGKTTTIRLLTGQLDPTAGSATVAGCDILQQRAQLKPRIGVVFEQQNLYDRLSARRNLLFFCRLYGVPERRADETLDLVGLRDRAKDTVGKFSNGMRQRLMIARALLHQPVVLFLDEPTRGLDPIAARDVRQVVQQLSQAGTTILLTTHLMEEADQLCQRVAFMIGGRLVANDTPRTLKLAHGKRALLVTLSGDEHPGARHNNLQDDLQVDLKDDLEDQWLNPDNAADQARLEQWLAAGRVRAIHSQEATLEEVFVEIAGMRPA